MTLISKDISTGAGPVEFELDEKECAAIGRVTVHWAYLEHAVLLATFNLAAVQATPVPRDSKSAAFSRRLRALGILAKQSPDESERRRLERLIGRIANAEQDRHKMTHGIWDWDRANPERLQASSFRPGYEFEKRYDAEGLHKLADRFGQISFDLVHPEGWDVAYEKMLAESADAAGDVAFISISRSLARSVRARPQEAPSPLAGEGVRRSLTDEGSH